MTSVQPLILIVEDEAPIRRSIAPSLQHHGYRLLEAENGAEGLALASEMCPDIVLLDLGLPDIDGLEVTRRLREWTQTPIIVVSARGQERDKIDALDAGADDYLTKPFSVGELLARLRVALRHSALRSSPVEESSYCCDALEVDFARRRVLVRGEEVHLTPLEYKLLATLAQHAGRVLTHKFLLGAVWGKSYRQESHYLRVYMGQLRHKIEEYPARPRYLLTDVGVGYRLTSE